MVSITADTNVLVRLATLDDPDQAAAAKVAVNQADLIVVPLPVLCELVWVLKSFYRLSRHDIAEAVRRLVASEKVKANLPAIKAGLALLEAGGDFADGVIAHLGATDGAPTFVSFDQAACDLLGQQGYQTHLLAADPNTKA
ncbi:MAG: type II toxin-antitoxin system VapC family toxin [Bifidobacteriaceae bacterium]|jgi:predicted nucleic-acid-binding protein|nr:type II toxin-antitoxin system VapC family toxin [Bifidobacteriaceae bacterium]